MLTSWARAESAGDSTPMSVNLEEEVPQLASGDAQRRDAAKAPPPLSARSSLLLRVREKSKAAIAPDMSPPAKQGAKRRQPMTPATASATMTPPPKQRRRGSSFQSTPPSDRAKTDNGSDGGGGGEPAAAEDEGPKMCIGCHRWNHIDKSFLLEGESIRSLYADSRGVWCKDCHGVYRVCYKEVMTLSLFGRWVKIPANH